MLVDFSVENFGPFRDKATLSMRCTASDEHLDNLIDCPAIGEAVLNSVAVFGPNSSGKSYLVHAISALIHMVSSLFPTDIKYQWYEPFRLSSKTVNAPVSMNIRFVKGGVLYDYSLSFNHNQVLSESLYHYPNGRKSRVFKREGQDFEFTKSTKCEMEPIVKATSKNSTYLAVASRLNNEVCIKAHQGIVQDIIFVQDDGKILFGSVTNMMIENPEAKKLMVKSLRISDFGISDLECKMEVVEASDPLNRISSEALKQTTVFEKYNLIIPRVWLKHNLDVSDVSEEASSFPIEIESKGTRQMFYFMGPIIDALLNGKTIFIDEFGSYLHSDISRWIISQFKLDSNPKGAQIIVNTHDQMLMDTDALFRRDQILFTQKNSSDGASELYSLSDFKGIRKDTNIQKSYSIGRYDALPFISPENVME